MLLGAPGRSYLVADMQLQHERMVELALYLVEDSTTGLQDQDEPEDSHHTLPAVH